MKLCDTCIYRNENEYHKPCIVYRDDCEYYEEERDDMTREEITQLNTDYLNDCESEHEMNELFYFVLELLKHEQESSCPYYVIDEDGHGLCKNHRLEQEPKTGHWIAKSFHEVFCDNCGFDFDIMRNDFIDRMNYCPNCGCRMVDVKLKAGTPRENYEPLYNCENWIP